MKSLLLAPLDSGVGLVWWGTTFLLPMEFPFIVLVGERGMLNPSLDPF